MRPIFTPNVRAPGTARPHFPYPVVLPSFPGSRPRAAACTGPADAPARASSDLAAEPIDVLIAGAGFSGLVIAERLSNAGLRCVVVEHRNHIGGNAYDAPDRNGVLYHLYGPHYFRTNSAIVRDYLSQFTAWQPVEYRIKSWTDGRFWSFPVNLNTFEEYLGRPSTEEEFRAWIERHRVPIGNPANSEEVILSRIGREFYEKFFEGYTLKQWNRHPRDLDPSVCARIPLRTNRDDHYLREEFQALPVDGYTSLFERMIDRSPGLRILTGTDFFDVARHFSPRHTVYTGPVDAYFAYRYGPLPYRSMRFELESFTADQLAGREAVSGTPGFWQPAMQVNYPNDYEFTRIVEIKHATRQQTPHTNIVREYPLAADTSHEPYYPVPAPDTRALYEKYRILAAAEPNVTFAGRLATYHYYNMDQVTGLALRHAARIQRLLRPAVVS